MSAVAARRWALIVAPVLAGVLAVIATIADPAPRAQDAELIRAYAANPDRIQLKSVSYHFAYALWLMVVFPLVGMVRRRGAWLANLAGVLAVLSISTIPGFLAVDFLDSAMGQIVGAETALRIGERAMQGWGFAAMAAPGGIGLLLALPLATIAAWRAGFLEWWGPVATVVGFAAFMLFGATLPGNIILAVAFVVLSAALSRIDYGTSAGTADVVAAGES